MSAVPPRPPAPAVLTAPESLDSSLLRVLMDTSEDRIYFKDRQSRFVRNNVAHARSLGANSPEDCVGKSDVDFFSREHAERAFADEQEIIRTGRPIIAKIERLTMLGGAPHGWASSTKMPWRNAAGEIIGTFGLTRDITAAKEAEDKLNEERILLRTIVDHLPSRLYVKDTSSRYVLNNLAHLEALGAKSQDETRGHNTLHFFPGERGQQAMKDDLQVFGGVPIINQEKSDFGPAGDVHWSLVTKVALRDAENHTFGLVGISHDITWRKRAEEELQRRSDEMEADLKMARQVQEAFLNRTYPLFPLGARPEESKLHFAHRYIPTTTLGGDFFDILQLSGTQCGVLICDVMGHGVRAGLLTALIRGVVEETGPRAADPSHVIREVNASLMPIVEQTGQPVFATAFFAVIDTAAHTLTYCNAGHPAPFVRHGSDDTITRLAPDDPEPATGLIGAFPYSHRTVPFGPGDLFLGYTDGLLEAADQGGEIFGEKRMCEVLAASRGLPGAALNERLLHTVQRYCGHSHFEDDVCLVAIEAHPTGHAPASPPPVPSDHSG